VKPLQSKDVQRLRNCSTAARPSNKGGATLPCEENAVAKWSNNKLPPSAGATSPSGRRANLAGVAMVRTHHVALPSPRAVRLKLNVSLTVTVTGCFSASARCCTRRAWRSRSTCRSCSSSSCWRTPRCAWASSCTDGRRVAAARSPRGAPDQEGASSAKSQQRCKSPPGHRRQETAAAPSIISEAPIALVF
jgi:hypothetical protein